MTTCTGYQSANASASSCAHWSVSVSAVRRRRTWPTCASQCRRHPVALICVLPFTVTSSFHGLAWPAMGLAVSSSQVQRPGTVCRLIFVTRLCLLPVSSANSRLSCSSGHITWDHSTFVIVYYKSGAKNNIDSLHCVALHCIILYVSRGLAKSTSPRNNQWSFWFKRRFTITEYRKLQILYTQFYILRWWSAHQIINFFMLENWNDWWCYCHCNTQIWQTDDKHTELTQLCYAAKLGKAKMNISRRSNQTHNCKSYLVPYKFPENSACSTNSLFAIARVISSRVTK